ncbi:hypothetical protein [Amycolatopsis sp. DG1A-15b]|uniref:hypothetical protein n=1 Tax=Amycolatopsis sp. DG1A-15b TaxID=3052846 RepID=UPI00255B8ACE|nr:hypothetical protein [Amycolatopsis sp. DG1A-15b]WIX93023.1 hypothetical protein QRY02_22315 [Amycolatopsis sp. DG1A-15b]
MTGTPKERLTRVIDDMRARWNGRDVVMAVNHFNGGMKALAEELRLSGARLKAVVINTVPRADDPPAEHVWSCAEHGLTMTHRQYEAWLASKPPEIVDWLDGLDPGREWEVLGTTYGEFAELGGRPAYGHWRPEWAGWEDKTRIDELWRRVGIPAPPHAIVEVDDPGLAATAVSLDRGHGVMIAIDTSLDVLGSSQGLRWVRSRAELDRAVEALRVRTKRVRLATFVPGVPCSLMGMVFDDGVAVFDPIEVITLHRPSTGQLVYGGCSTAWRPATARTETLRGYARRVGEELSASLGYTGVFSVDGLSGEDGFVATELNPRHVSGIGVRPGWPEFPTRLLNRAVQDHRPEAAGARWQDVEVAYREVVRDTPSASLWIEVPGTELGPEGRVSSTTLPVPAGDAVVECVVEYRPQCGGVWILGAAGVDSAVPHDGALGPVTAALAERLGVADLRSFGEITARSTLAG